MLSYLCSWFKTTMETPLRNKNNQTVKERFNEGNVYTPERFAIPETPMLRRLGFGTGVGVYHFDRTLLASRSPKSPWAIKKVLREFDTGDYSERLHREATVLRSLNHPNIVGYRGFTVTSDGREVLAMEECSTSLSDMIEERFEKTKEIFSPTEVIKVVCGVANALSYLHNEVMLMHGDIKSHNILINGDFQQVKLCDYGVSIKTDEKGTALEKYIGTSCWTPPEALYDKFVTTKADVFALGLVIYEMLALQPPHVGPISSNESECDELEDSIYEENYGTRPELPDDIKSREEYKSVLDLFKLCTEQDPDKRPSAKDIVDIYQFDLP